MTSCSYSLAFFLALTLLRLRFVERVAWFTVQMEDERCVTPGWTGERAGRDYVISLEESAEHSVRSPRLLVRTVEHHSAIVSAVSVLRAVSWDFAPDGKFYPLTKACQ